MIAQSQLLALQAHRQDRCVLGSMKGASGPALKL